MREKKEANLNPLSFVYLLLHVYTQKESVGRFK